MNLHEDLECNICGTNLKDKFCHTLDCNHIFHYECLMKTFQSTNNKLQYKNSCPYCRKSCNYLPIVNGLRNIIPGIHCSKKIQNINESKNILQDSYSKPCQFILTRGKNKGKPCGKKCLLGYDYCGTHKKIMKL